MTDTSAGNGETGATAEERPTGPQLSVNAQYVKDLSFENPSAPQSLANTTPSPPIDISVDVGARSISENQYEVTLSITANATRDGNKMFVMEIAYAGLFTVGNIPNENLRPILLIECPRYLFPFARQIVSNATQHGGWPPLLMEPIDFAGLYNAAQNNPQGGEQS